MPAGDPSALSIVICAYDGLEYTKLLLESIRKHSSYEHEIVIYSDGSSDGTKEWLREQKDISWQHDNQNRGICTAMNRAAAMATREYLFFPNTDHVLAPSWDKALLRRLEERTVVSSQCIEPGIVPVAPIFVAQNCGTRWDAFDEEEFVRTAARISKDEAVPGINYPFAISRKLWDELGGLDTRFDPGPANDPDLFYRLFLSGAKMVRAMDSILYHFSGKSSRMAGEAEHEHRRWHEVTVRNETRFEKKWGERYRYSNGGLPAPGEEAKKRWQEMGGGISVESRFHVAIDARSVQSKSQGIGTYTANLIEALLQLPDPPRISCIANDPDTIGERIAPRKDLKIVSVKVRPGDTAAETAQIAPLVSQCRADLYHGPAFTVSQGVDVPAVITIHDLAFLLYPQWYPAPFRSHLERELRRSVRQARGIIAVSEKTRTDLGKRLGVAKEKIDRIYEALPQEFAKLAAEPLDEKAYQTLTGKDRFLLSVGVQQPRKNALGLVKAFAELKRKRRFRGKLLLVGGAHCEDPQVEKEIRKRQLQKHVVLTGFLPLQQLVSLYKACSVFVYPSHYEGFGIPPLEAFACGAPLVCSDAASLPEVVGDAAKFCSPDDPASIAKAIFSVTSDSELREELIKKGRQRLAHFSWKSVAQETLNSYQKALSSAPAKAVETPPPARSEPAVRKRPRIAFDGRLLDMPQTGTGAYSRKILGALLDHAREKAKDVEFVLVGPEHFDTELLPRGTSILSHIPAGRETLLNPAWEQFSLPRHLLGCDLYFSPSGILPIPRSCKAVTVVHDLGFEDHPDCYDPVLRDHLSRWIKNACLSADQIVAVSRFTRSRIRALYGIGHNRISVIHHGETAAPRQNGRGGTKFHILCVSSFEPNKNLGLLLEAVRLLPKSLQVRLVLAGRRGRDLEKVQELAGSAPLKDRAELHVDVEEQALSDLYAQADLFVFPSLYEGFGLPILEAMSAGLPVIVTDAASCPEVLGKAGLVIKKPRPQKLSGAIGELVKNPRRRETLAKAARARARRFRWSRAAEQTFDVFDRCLRKA